MKVRLIDIKEGDIVYYMGSEYLVDRCLLIQHCLHCTNLKTKRFSIITSHFVELCFRQLELF